MPQGVDSVASALEQLSQQVQNLERRVLELEGRREAAAAGPQAVSVALERPRPPATWRGFPPVEGSSGVVTILGKAVLGIAGAYLLRALAESSSIPKLPVLFVAILYSYFWMVLAARVHRSSRFASATYGVTSALILSPLLWESTVRFQVLSPAFAAVWLVVFVVLALGMAWREKLQILPWIAVLASVGTAIALIIASRELVALTGALLAVSLAVEIATGLGQRLTMRVIPALGADFAVWLLVYVMTSSEGVPEGYHAASPGMIAVLSLGLLAIYGGSIAVRSFGSRQRMTVFDIVQGVVAFAVASFGILRSSNSAGVGLGALFLLLAGACYWGALQRFTGETYVLNRRVSATWAAGLMLAGTFLLFPSNLQAPFLCVAAVAAAFVYTRTDKVSLGIHASVYLAAAAGASDLWKHVAGALAGTVPTRADWSAWTVGVLAVVGYVVGARHREEQGNRRLLWFVPTLLFSFAGAALCVVTVARLAESRWELGASALSVIRTVVNCGLALILGILGSKLKRMELAWVAYAAVGFGTIKLLFEDLRFGNAASLVVSLLFYGLILILLPRLARR